MKYKTEIYIFILLNSCDLIKHHQNIIAAFAKDRNIE